MKLAFFYVAFLLLLMPTLALAVEYPNLISIPGVNGEQVSGFGGYINALYLLSISIAAILAVIKIIIGGVKYMLSDVVTNKSDAKSEIKGALIGLLLIISAVLILEVINPNITKNDVGFTQIETFKSTDLKQGGIQLTQTQTQQCTGYTNLTAIPYDNGKSCNQVSGPGWVGLDGACCDLSAADSDRICCGYNPPTATSTPPNVGTGDFTLTIVERDNINNCYAELVNKYPTLAACTTQMSSVTNNSNQAIDTDCEGTVVESPATRYNQITSLPSCS